jgi:hypothetical protein
LNIKKMNKFYFCSRPLLIHQRLCAITTKLMKLSSNYLLILLCGLLTTSCVSIDNSSIRQISSLEKNDFKKLEGQFSNYPIATTKQIVHDMYPTKYQRLTLWTYLSEYQNSDSIERFKEQIVTLDFISKRKVMVKLWDNGQCINSKDIKGRIRRGYFYYGNHFIVLPFFPLIFGHYGYRSRIGLTTTNSIIINHKWNDWRFYVFAGHASKGQRNAEFSRK